MSVLYVFVILLLIQDPRGIIFLGDYVPEKYFYFPIRLAVIIFHAYVAGGVFASVSILIGFTVWYIIYMYFLISLELRIGKKTYVTFSQFRKPVNIRNFYRALQVLHQQAMLHSRFGFYIMVFNALFMINCVYFTFVLLRFWKELKFVSKAPIIVADFLGFGYWTFVLFLGCKFCVGGNKTLTSWRKHDWGFGELNKLMIKFHKSCRVIVFSHGIQFVIGRMTLLRFFRGVVRGTFRALLAYE